MDSKEGIEKVTPVDAQAAGLLDPSLLRPGTHDAATADPPREWAGSPTGSCISPDEHSRWESNCLYVRVLRDSDAILEQDRKVPEYCWNASISKDICEAWTGVVPGTFSVDLLSDTEFLVYRVPKMTRGMSNHEARCYADLIMGLSPSLSPSGLPRKPGGIKLRLGNIAGKLPCGGWPLLKLD